MNIVSCSEADVFKSCMAWARAKSNQNTLTKTLVEEHLGDLYYKIRFASMTVQEFCSFQAEYESVLQSDLSTIINMIVLPEFRTEKFSNDSRRAKWDPDAIIECNRISKKGSEIPCFTKDKLTLTFSMDQPLVLGSFECSKIRFFDSSFRDLNSDLPVEVEIFEICNSSEQNPKLLVTMKVKLKSMDSNHIQLPYPILVRPKFLYKISIGQFPDHHVFHSNEFNEVVRLKHDITVKFHNSISKISWIDFYSEPF